MKVIHLISSLDKGGAESQLVQLVNLQLKQGIKIKICYLKGNSYWVDYLEKNNIQCYFLNYKNSFNLISLLITLYSFWKIINNFKPDIIHSHLSPSEIVSYLVSFFVKNIKFITTKHLDSLIFTGSKTNVPNLFSKFIENIILNRNDKIICISNSVLNFFLKNTKISKSKFILVYYGIDYNLYDSNYSHEVDLFYKKYNLSREIFIIGNIARHVPQKNILFLIKAFKLFNEEKRNKSKLILVGNGPLTSKLKKISKKQNIYKDIIWIDYFENNPILYKVFDVFCLTSDYEGLGLVLLEALSAKTPVVATNISAIPELIKDKKNGFLVEQNNHEQLSEILSRLQEFDLTHIKENGRKLIENKFSTEKMSSKILDVYKGILGV